MRHSSNVKIFFLHKLHINYMLFDMFKFHILNYSNCTQSDILVVMLILFLYREWGGGLKDVGETLEREKRPSKDEQSKNKTTRRYGGT